MFARLFCALVVLTAAEPLARELPGVHNLQRVTDKLLSGSSPEGDAGFATLRDLGVKTVISVDGARPEVERARKFGMRYVHLPIGYNAVPPEQGLRIARAVRDLPGLVYLHCHHGKHRGPAAAAVAMLCLDDKCTMDAALDFMKRAGTDQRYAGLYDSPKRTPRPTRQELDKVSAVFPEVAIVSALAHAMVEIDEHWEAIKLVKKAGWKTPSDHPDIVPPQEALILAQFYGQAAENAKNVDMKQWLTEAASNAQTLAKLLSDVKAKNAVGKLDAAFEMASMDCSRCHARHRDASK